MYVFIAFLAKSKSLSLTFRQSIVLFARRQQGKAVFPGPDALTRLKISRIIAF